MARRYRYAMCVKNRGFTFSLEVRKVYRLIAEQAAERRRLVRVIDESGEDYLYPANYFTVIQLPRSAMRLFPRKTG